MISDYLTRIRNFNSIRPISKLFGADRGKAIDRHYIENFLLENSSLIHGSVLEVGSNEYTKKFGSEKVEKSCVLHVNRNTNADIIGNLETGEGIPENEFDCFIMTQTLLCIFDVQSAARNALKLIKSGGNILLTVPGITKISRFDYERWGHYWSFTDQSVHSLFEKLVPHGNILINTYGNVRSASAFLYGLAEHELRRKYLDKVDSDYQLIISAIIKK